MRQTCVTNARRPCGLPRVCVAGLCCRVVLLGCVAGLNGQVGTLDWLVGRAFACVAGWRLAREIATRELATRSGLSRGSPWPCRHPPPPRLGPADHAVQRLGPATGYLERRGRASLGVLLLRAGWAFWIGSCHLDRLCSHSERHNLSRLLSPIRIGPLPATVRMELWGARGMSP